MLSLRFDEANQEKSSAKGKDIILYFQIVTGLEKFL